MCALQEWTLLLMFGILNCVADVRWTSLTGSGSSKPWMRQGHPGTVQADKLHTPLNIKTESRNFSLFLTWLPAPEDPTNVTYKVKYMLVSEKRWRVVCECNSIFTTECDLTCALGQNYSNLHTVKVKAVSVFQKKWAYLYNITYMFTVDPSPPILKIIQDSNTMTINTSIPKPHCMPSSFAWHLAYRLEISNKNNRAEQKRQIEMSGPSHTIKTDGYEGEYCVTAQTIYKAADKISELSHSVCFNFTQKEENHYAIALVGLPVMLSVIFVAALITIIWYKTNENATIPKALTFSDKKYDLAVSVIPEENSYPLTINKNMDQTSSATFLLSSEDGDSINEYPLSGCGYTERKTVPGNSIRSNSHYGDSTSDEYMSSKGLPTNSSSDKSSDSSCIQTSGSNTEITLMLNKRKLHNQSKEISTDVSVNMETLVTSTLTIGPLLDTLCVSNCKGFGDVLLNTLTSAAATDQCLSNEPNDCHLTDSEDDLEQLSNDCTDSDMTGSYEGPQTLQTNGSSGYKQRGYMSRR